jgi:uncharacterized delta-60 repeat protein
MKTLSCLASRQIMGGCASLLGLLCLSARAQNWPKILSCPDQAVVLGQTATFTVIATGAPPLRYQWGRGHTNIPGATNATLILSNATFADADKNYWVWVENEYGEDDWDGIRLTVLPPFPMPGFVDATFQTPYGANTLLALADGRLLVGGFGVSRLWPNGGVDASFVPNAGETTVYKMALQPDGKLVVFTGGLSRGVSRLNADGTPDSSFVPPDFLEGNPFLLAFRISAFAGQPDGKVLVAYRLLYAAHDDDWWLNPIVRRLNPDGSGDGSFAQIYLSCHDVRGLAVMPDGRILVGSDNLICLRPDGQWDNSFVVNRLEPPPRCPSPGLVSCFVFQPDGKILIGGSFTNVAGQPRSHVARLHPNGALDFSFNPPVSSAEDEASVGALVLQADSKVLVGGHFTTMNGLPYEGLARLNPDGTLDTSFVTGLGLLEEEHEEGSVAAILVQSSDKALVAGWFSDYWGTPVHGITRVLLTEPPVSPVVAPQTAEPTNCGNAIFQFRFTNPGSYSFAVLASTNLSWPTSYWTVLGSPTNLGGSVYQFTDLDSTNHRQRFYRLRWP